MTSLTVEEFELLHGAFAPYCTNYFHYHTLQGKPRTKLSFTEQRNASLKGSEMKLFFLLSYLKNYPLQQFHASYFGVTQAKVSCLVKVLLPILEKTLKKMGVCPCTTPGQLSTELKKHQIGEANMDATEREVNRSSDHEVQKEFYSGKKNGIR
ncbi:MAG: transposase family protein [Draconibacterium sp.]